MRVAIAQLEITGGDVAGNRDRARAAIEAAADAGADLVALPEMFTVGYFAFERYRDAAEPLEGPTVAALRDAAGAHDLWVLGGSFVEDLSATDGHPTPADSGLANTAPLLAPDGELALVYRKHHLFGYGSAEQELLVPGRHLDVVDVGEWTVGVTTCYDLRFPELYRDLVDLGATLVLVPSAWPYPRVEHWSVLSRARAIENQWYLATVNGTGTFPADGGAESEPSTLLGRSTVYDPWGVPVASSGDDPDLLTVELDPGRVRAVREEFPALADRRDD